MEFLTDYKKTD